MSSVLLFYTISYSYTFGPKGFKNCPVITSVTRVTICRLLSHYPKRLKFLIKKVTIFQTDSSHNHSSNNPGLPIKSLLEKKFRKSKSLTQKVFTFKNYRKKRDQKKAQHQKIIERKKGNFGRELLESCKQGSQKTLKKLIRDW